MDLLMIMTDHMKMGENVQGVRKVVQRGTITSVCSSSWLTELPNEYQLIV